MEDYIMSMISKQIKELRKLSEDIKFVPSLRKIFKEAADTIESLSAKLQAENMERSAEDCGKDSAGKSILIIDTPKECNDCPLFTMNQETLDAFCIGFAGRRKTIGCYIPSGVQKPDWCPLRYPSEDRGGWTYCGDGNNLPKEPFGCIVTVIDTEPTTMTDFEAILPYQVGYSGGTWNDSDGEAIPFKVIAWMPAPKEPYHEP